MREKKVITTEILEDVVKSTSADKISIGDLMLSMHSGGFGLIMTIFSLPIIVPLPPPFPSLVSIPLIVFSIQMILGLNSPKLPKKLANMSIKRTMLARLVEKSAPYIRKAESIVKPRLLLLSSDLFRRVIGLFCLIFASSILLPLPLSNLLPGIGILITSFGLIGRDGLIIIFGLTIGCIGTLITITAILLGVEALYMLKDLIF